MWEIFNPILSWLRDLLDNRLTTARAAKLDNLDAAVSTRAAADTAVSNANYTATRAGYLDHLNMAAGKIAAAEDSPLLDVPIANGLVGEATTAVSSTNMGLVSGVSQAGTNSTTLANVVNYTGQGVLEFCTTYKPANATATARQVIIIDGVTVSDLTTTTNQYAFVTGAGAFIPGSAPVIALSQIPFKASLQIQHSSSDGTSIGTYYKYRRTG